MVRTEMSPPLGNERILNGRSIFPDLRYIVFDLEATLFWSEPFKHAMFSRAVVCISGHCQVAEDGARNLILQRRESLATTLGYTPALSATVLSFGISVDEWVKCQSTVSIEDTIPPPVPVLALLRAVAAKCRLIVYTNMAERLATEILDHLRVASLFDRVYHLQTFGRPKPDPSAIRRIIGEGVLEPQLSIAVGDRYHLDLAPIISSGGYGYLIGSPHCLNEFLEKAVAAKGHS